GVKIRRSLGASQAIRHDPFLMLDEFFSDDPRDYLAGFPSHPHRGFETVTYMLDGHMRHEDHLGNRGDLGPGDVQWMTAARGIVHSEMPQQTEGRMRGFQLWINLPANEKMKAASYRDIPASEIPAVQLPGVSVRVIAGTLGTEEGTTDGPVQGPSTEPLYFDIALDANSRFEVPVPAGHNVFVYVYEGRVHTGDKDEAIEAHHAGLLSDGDRVTLQSTDSSARLLLIGGKPINEPVVQYGPFVMNTREEIEQALADYREGRLAV
ncbi:MAG: pirin family protein, partial [Pseudomonadales bacterium]|nr:pirin family protein [Pseudomonadales bacterium]